VTSGAAEGDCWTGDDPVGAMAAAAAAAADGVRAALRHISDQLGVSVPSVPGWSGELGREVDLDLHLLKSSQNLGDVEVVSGGAITNAALFALLRVPDVGADVRVIEPDTYGTSNLNRYALGRRSQVDLPKVDILTSFGNDHIPVGGLTRRLDETFAAELDHSPATSLSASTTSPLAGSHSGTPPDSSWSAPPPTTSWSSRPTRATDPVPGAPTPGTTAALVRSQPSRSCRSGQACSRLSTWSATPATQTGAHAGRNSTHYVWTDAAASGSTRRHRRPSSPCFVRRPWRPEGGQAEPLGRSVWVSLSRASEFCPEAVVKPAR